MSASQRLREVLKLKRISVESFCDKYGLVKGTLYKMWKIDSDPSLQLIRIYLKEFPGLNAEWLITGEGEMFSNVSEKKPGIFVSKENFELLQKDVEKLKAYMRQLKE